MFEELLKQQNPHWSGESYDAGAARACFPQLLSYLETKQVIAITGVRRAGKSTLIKQLIHHLIHKEKIAPNRILFLNLEHPYLSPYREDPTILERIFEDYLKTTDPEGEVYLCLDEVQFFREWPVFVKAHHETKKVRFVVTGSNAAMLSSDMITLLSGRSLPLEVFPFSFREVAAAKNLPVESIQPSKLRNLLNEFLEYGGFPTVVLGTQNQTAFDILGAHARTVLMQDVVPRLGIRKPQDLEKLYVYLVSNLSKLFSYSSLSKLFGLSDKSIKEYLQALSGAHLLYEVDLFSYSMKKQIKTPKKIYSIDTGQANAMGFKFSKNQGRLLENLIFIDLKRLGFDVYYYKTKQDREVDFLIKRGEEFSLLQVTWDLSDPDTREREIRSLKEGIKELSLQKGIIITAEKHSPIDPNIEVIPAYNYLSLSPKERIELLFPST